MKAAVVLLLLAVPLVSGAADPATPAVPTAPAAPQAVSAQPSDEAIRQAVREVLEEHPEEWRHPARTISSDKYQQFAEQFSEARVPDCLHSDALKRQPPAIGPIGFSGLYAAPFVVLAKIRGKCN